MKTRMVILFLIGTVSLNAFGNGLKILKPCMNITHSGEVEGCFIELSQSMKIKYTNEFDLYLKSINTQEERPYNKKELTTLSESAKKTGMITLKMSVRSNHLAMKRAIMGMFWHTTFV